MEDFVETPLCELGLILRLRVLRFLCGLNVGYTSPYSRKTKSEAAEVKECIYIPGIYIIYILYTYWHICYVYYSI